MTKSVWLVFERDAKVCTDRVSRSRVVTYLNCLFIVVVFSFKISKLFPITITIRISLEKSMKCISSFVDVNL